MGFEVAAVIPDNIFNHVNRLKIIHVNFRGKPNKIINYLQYKMVSYENESGMT